VFVCLVDLVVLQHTDDPQNHTTFSHVPRNVQQLDSVDHVSQIEEVGRAVAKEVNIDHFTGFLQND